MLSRVKVALSVLLAQESVDVYEVVDRVGMAGYSSGGRRLPVTSTVAILKLFKSSRRSLEYLFPSKIDGDLINLIP